MSWMIVWLAGGPARYFGLATTDFRTGIAFGPISTMRSWAVLLVDIQTTNLTALSKTPRFIEAAVTVLAGAFTTTLRLPTRGPMGWCIRSHSNFPAIWLWSRAPGETEKPTATLPLTKLTPEGMAPLSSIGTAAP